MTTLTKKCKPESCKILRAHATASWGTLQTRFLVIGVIVVVAAGVLVSPWLPVARSETITETFTYAYEVPTQSYETQNVYTLPSSVTLKGLFQSGATLAEVYQELESVHLETGWVVHVEVNQCQYCSLSVAENFGSKVGVFSVTGSATGDFIVPQSGQYEIGVVNFGDTQGRVTEIRITADAPWISSEHRSAYNTVTHDRYSIESLSPLATMFPAFNSPLLRFSVLGGVVICVLLVLGYLAVKETQAKIPEPGRYCISCGTATAIGLKVLQ